MTLPLPNLDDRTYADLLEEARSLIPSEYPSWTDHNPSDTGIILLELFAWLTEMVLYRVNQIPDRNIETFLRLLNGVDTAEQSSDLQTAIRETVLELRQRYRAVTTEDFEQLALHDWHNTLEAEKLGDLGWIRRVRCLPQVNLESSSSVARRLAPGHLSLVVVPSARSANRALSLNRLQDRVELPQLPVNPTAFTVSFWLRFDQSTATTAIAHNWGLVTTTSQDANQPWKLGNWWFLTAGTSSPQDPQPQWGVKFGTSTTLQQSLMATWRDTNWHHIAGTCDGTTLNLYVDGMPVPRRPLSLEMLPVGAGLLLYVAGSSFRAGSDRWDDLSGQSNHAVRAANIEMPSLFQVQDHNGKAFPVLRFSNQSGINFPDTLNLQKPFTVMIVDRYYGTTRGRTLQSRDNNWLLGKHGGNNGCYMEGWMGNPYPATPNVFTISTVTLEGNISAWYVDGVLKGSNGGTTAPGKLALCRAGRFGNEVSEADVAAVLIWNRVLTPQERQTVEACLGQQYGIAVPQSTATATSPAPVHIGGSGNATDAMGTAQRRITDVAIWNRARSASEIQADMRRQLTGEEAGLLGYWPLDEGTGQMVGDRTPARTPGRIVGAEWLLFPHRTLRTGLWNFLDQRRLLTTQHHVVEPEYIPVSITTTLRLEEGASSDRVRQAAIATLRRFFDPLEGGQDGQGWPFGRNIYISEVYELLDRVPGVDYVEALSLQNDSLPPQTPSPTEIPLQAHQLVALRFSDNQLTLKEAWQET